MSAPTPRYRLGLVVGKFSPLHRGHAQVIEAALAQCEQVLVLGYSQPEFRGCERARREAWIARCFPSVINVQIDDAQLRRHCAALGIAAQPIPPNTAADAAHQDYLAWLLRGPVGLVPDAMFGSEAYLAPCAHTLSRQLGCAVEPVCVDLERVRHPISATRIRADVHAHRAWLDPAVYRDFVPRVVFLGGESSGKTTLARAMADHTGTAWVPEYGRERWEQCGGQLTQADLIEIARIQIAREEALHAQAERYLFCDTSALTTLGYAQWMFGTEPPELVAMARRAYDLIVLCAPDFDFVQDGTRRDAAFRLQQHAWYEARLTRSDARWIPAGGTLPQRIARVAEILPTLWDDRPAAICLRS